MVDRHGVVRVVGRGQGHAPPLLLASAGASSTAPLHGWQAAAQRWPWASALGPGTIAPPCDLLTVISWTPSERPRHRSSHLISHRGLSASVSATNARRSM